MLTQTSSRKSAQLYNLPFGTLTLYSRVLAAHTSFTRELSFLRMRIWFIVHNTRMYRCEILSAYGNGSLKVRSTQRAIR